MSDLIERSGAIDALKDMYQAAEKWGQEASDDIVKARAESCMASLIEMKLRIEKLPSAQPERKTGEWQITDSYPHNVYCSECHTKFAQTHWAVWEDGSLPRKFCPNCGIKMREIK